MSLFDRRPTIELSPDTQWVIQQCVSHMQAMGFTIITDDSTSEVQDQTKRGAVQLTVLKPDNLVTDLVEKIERLSAVNSSNK